MPPAVTGDSSWRIVPPGKGGNRRNTSWKTASRNGRRRRSANVGCRAAAAVVLEGVAIAVRPAACSSCTAQPWYICSNSSQTRCHTPRRRGLANAAEARRQIHWSWHKRLAAHASRTQTRTEVGADALMQVPAVYRQLHLCQVQCTLEQWQLLPLSSQNQRRRPCRCWPQGPVSATETEIIATFCDKFFFLNKPIVQSLVRACSCQQAPAAMQQRPACNILMAPLTALHVNDER